MAYSTKDFNLIQSRNSRNPMLGNSFPGLPGQQESQHQKKKNKTRPQVAGDPPPTPQSNSSP